MRRNKDKTALMITIPPPSCPNGYFSVYKWLEDRKLAMSISDLFCWLCSLRAQPRDGDLVLFSELAVMQVVCAPGIQVAMAKKEQAWSA
jgi:hypothetical protein